MAAQIMPSSELKYGLQKDISTENWMSSLPISLQNDLPISRLAIPGTHDSGTFSLSRAISPDAGGCLTWLTKIPLIGSSVKKVIVNWAECQDLSFTEQLFAGIRYFDLRVAVSSDSNDFCLVHTVFGPKLSDLLDALLTFLETHPQEVVLLDFNHFYAMKTKHHKLLIEYLISKLGSKLCNRCDVSDLTLQKLWYQRQQVIIFYHNETARHIDEMWPANRILSPWANTDNPDKCIEYLSKVFSKSPTTDFTVCQGVLTPNANTIMKGIGRGQSVRTLSQSLLPKLCLWVEKSPDLFAYPLTIIIADYVENGDFIQSILKLNYKRSISL